MKKIVLTDSSRHLAVRKRLCSLSDFTGGIGDGDSLSETYIAKEYALSLGCDLH